MQEVEELFNDLKEKVVGKSTETEEEATQIKVNECLTGIAEIKSQITVLEAKLDGPGEGQAAAAAGGGRRRRRRRSKKSKKKVKKNSKRGNISKKR